MEKSNGYWTVIKPPVIVLIALSIIKFLFEYLNRSNELPDAYLSATGWLGVLVALIAFLFVGWRAVKTYEHGLMRAAIAGGIAGVIVIIVLKITDLGFNQITTATLMNFVSILAVTNYCEYAVAGGVIALIGAFAAQNTK